MRLIFERCTAGERHHSRMYREYTWQRDTAGERHHSRMYRELELSRETELERETIDARTNGINDEADIVV